MAEAIAVATRSVHAKLNKLIIARLPLALPPQAADSSSYVTGLLHIAPIYIAFESAWRDILVAKPASTPKEESDADGHNPELSPPTDLEPQNHEPLAEDRIRSLLQQLYLPELARSDRLRADIIALTGWPDHIVQEQLMSVCQMGRFAEFIKHIKRSIEHRPHVLIAYSYILYMALFAGGRFIRASLEAAGEEFWEHMPSPVKPNMCVCQQNETLEFDRASGPPDEAVSEDGFESHASRAMPLRFFHFSTPMDGEDLKREFKNRLADSEGLLTDREKQDIVQESVCIFNNMTLLVQQLDTVCEESTEEDVESGESQQNPGLPSQSFYSRLRDSVAVTKERSARSYNRSSSSEDSTGTFVKQVRQAVPSCPASKPATRPLRHPPIADISAIGRCPAMSKSIRFEMEPEYENQPAASARPDLVDSLKMVSKRIDSARLTNLLVMVAFGAIVLGALMTSRQGLVNS